jgi:hypothetical protein
MGGIDGWANKMLREDEIAIREHAARIGPAAATSASPIGDPATIGEEFTITVSDDRPGIDYDETFVVLLDGTWRIILIEEAAYDSLDGPTSTSRTQAAAGRLWTSSSRYRSSACWQSSTTASTL